MKSFQLKPGFQLAILRMGVAIAVLFKIFAEFNDLDMLFSQQGIIQGVLSKPMAVKYALALPVLTDFFHIHNEHLFLSITYLIFGIAAIALLLGYQSRISAFICLLIHMMVFNGYNLLAFGFDGFLFSLLFYTFIFPVGKVYALDEMMGRTGPVDPENLKLYLLVLQLHLCVVYLTAGVSKSGQDWMGGTAIWKAINQPQFYTDFTPLFRKLLSFPGMSALLSWGTLFVEAFFPVLIFIRFMRINQLTLIAVVMMHLFIGAVMGLQLFAWIMIVFDLSAFSGVFLQKRAAEAEDVQSDKISEYMYLTGKR